MEFSQDEISDIVDEAGPVINARLRDLYVQLIKYKEPEVEKLSELWLMELQDTRSDKCYQYYKQAYDDILNFNNNYKH